MPAEKNDAYLWHLVTSNEDAAAFEQLYRRYVAVVFAAVSKHIEHREDISEIVQETFMNLWENRNKITIRNSFFSYLYTIARNKTFKHLKNIASKPIYVEHWQEFLEARQSDMPFTEQELVATTLIQAEHNLEQGIASLPNQMRLLFKLRFEDKLSNDQIAGQMNLSKETIKKNLTLLRKQIKKMVIHIFFF